MGGDYTPTQGVRYKPCANFTTFSRWEDGNNTFSVKSITSMIWRLKQYHIYFDLRCCSCFLLFQGYWNLNLNLKAVVTTQHVRLNFGTVQEILSKLNIISTFTMSKVLDITLSHLVIFKKSPITFLFSAQYPDADTIYSLYTDLSHAGLHSWRTPAVW